MNTNTNRQAQQMEQTAIEANAKRRIHLGTRSASMAAGPPLVPLNEVSCHRLSPFFSLTTMGSAESAVAWADDSCFLSRSWIRRFNSRST